jgi:hypothetical protein
MTLFLLGSGTHGKENLKQGNIWENDFSSGTKGNGMGFAHFLFIKQHNIFFASAF